MIDFQLVSSSLHPIVYNKKFLPKKLAKKIYMGLLNYNYFILFLNCDCLELFNFIKDKENIVKEKSFNINFKRNEIAEK